MEKLHLKKVSRAFADKIAAHTLLLQESSAHNSPSLKFCEVLSPFLTSREEENELLALWSSEYQLKNLYNQFLIALDGLLKDAVDTTPHIAITAIATLLSYSAEQEKVGDPTRVVATSTVGQMERLFQQHPPMKLVVGTEVERLLYRSNINTKAQYYALCFLSQILLDSDKVILTVLST